MSNVVPPRFFRLRAVLEATAPVRLHAHHAAAVYALLAAAYGRGRDGSPGLPDGLMIDAPEQCRVRVNPGELYALGFSLLVAEPELAGAIVRDIVAGLNVLGEQAGPNRPVWGGNFRLVAVEDLVAGTPWDEACQPAAIRADVLEQEAARLEGRSRLTLRFTTPYRRRRLKPDDRPGHAFFDRSHFDAELFLSSLWSRLADLGLIQGEKPGANGVSVAGNALVWLDISFGMAAERKRLGGCVGRVVLEGLGPAWVGPLVLGQYAHLGSNTRFGFGAYRIEELGPEPFACSRAVGLLDLALAGPALESAGERDDLPAGRLGHLADQLRSGTYEPGPSATLTIPRPDGSPRRLAIPSIEDRALQRAVHEQLAPGLDPFFEDSSFAFRRGLNRHGAARALADSWSDGFRWAVRADVHEFFDSIGHDELRDRLDAYAADAAITEAVLAWVRAGAPFPGRGLPTGAPLSPLLANLFLDGFDERIAAEGGWLIRYADDMLILTRSRDHAERLLAAAGAAAAEIELALNAEKTEVIALRHPFEFLGYRFEPRERWERRAGQDVVAVEDLGWINARAPYMGPLVIRLPGEPAQPADDGDLLVAGPGRYAVTFSGGRIICGDGETVLADERAGLEAVVLIGDPDIAAPVLRALGERGVPVFLTDSLMRDPIALVADEGPEDPAAIAGQLRIQDDEGRRLELARPIVAAKLRNHAVLINAVPGRHGDVGGSHALRALADRAVQAASFDELLGLEGSGARLWFDALADRLPPGWGFQRRVAPNADDPVNVLLNIAQTFLHRWSCLAVRSAGLLPSLGILHRPRPGHAALASDLQEPFRHLMDRTVLELTAQLRPADFKKTPAGRFPLTLLPHASQQVAAVLARSFRRGAELAGEAEPQSYRRRLFGSARGLRRKLADPSVEWRVFEQPG
ncbi:MAG TPA: CRISPR-associated endonuclease Cas1 [Isosphaeraceae bacterium]|nr:CRISPR-associated endonuclease Cas1 [Isosphaeraceae bacterium]